MKELTELEGIIDKAMDETLVAFCESDKVDALKIIAQAILDALPSLGYVKRGEYEKVLKSDGELWGMFLRADKKMKQ